MVASEKPYVDEQLPNGDKQLNADVLQLVALLRNPPKSLDVWKFDFARALEGIVQIVPSITAAVHAGEERTFSLTDVAYSLHNAGSIWSKRVDDVRRMCLQLTEMVTHRDSRKKKTDEDQNEGDEGQKKNKIRKRNAHPLTVMTDERIDEADFFPNREPRENPNRDRLLTQHIEKLPPDRYLAEAQPRSLGLLPSEKIQAYVDDRGTKGSDWAEYQINTLKLNWEGYFPLQETHPDFYEFTKPVEHARDIQPRQSEIDHIRRMNPDNDDAPDISGELPDAHHDDGPDFDHHSVIMNGVHPEVVQNGVMDKEKQKKISLGRPNRVQALPNVPFRGKMSISAEMRIRDLENSMLLPQMDEIDYRPYKRRNKRILKPPSKRPITAEVVFWSNFWDIRPDSKFCEPRFKKIFHRLRYRLRKVPQEGGQKRGRNKLAESTFVSSSEFELLGAPMSSPYRGLDFDTAQKCPHEEDALEEDRKNDFAEYVETDDPLSNNGTLLMENLGEHIDVFGEMRRQGRFAPDADAYDDMDVNSEEFDAGPVLQVDLYQWEKRLNKFLEVHEPQTLAFDLEAFGKNLVDNCEKAAGHNMQSLSQVVSRRTTGEVCRSFLSMLDLANKNVMQIGPQHEKATRVSDSSSQSQGVDEIGIRIC